MGMLKPLLQTVTVGLFLVGISLPLVDAAIDLDKTVFDENRTLADQPVWAWSFESLAAFPAAFEDWYNDHFGFRGSLIRGISLIRVKFLGTSSNQNVVLGRDGWLFWASPEPVEAIQGEPPYRTDQLELLQQHFESRRDRLAQMGVPYLIVIAPDKHEIYREYVPRMYAAVSSRGTRLDQFFEHMQNHSTLRLVDVRPALIQEKRADHPYYLFYKTDTHWTEIGGVVAANEIISATYRVLDWPGAVSPLSEYVISVLPQDHGNDLSRMLGLYSELREPRITAVPRTGFRSRIVDDQNVVPAQDTRPGRGVIVMEQANSDLPTAVVFRDSFAIALIPFLSEYFSRVVYYWQKGVDYSIIEREQPDIVIEEMVERVPGLLVAE